MIKILSAREMTDTSVGTEEMRPEAVRERAGYGAEVADADAGDSDAMVIFVREDATRLLARSCGLVPHVGKGRRIPSSKFE